MKYFFELKYSLTAEYKKRLVSRINPSLLLRFILYNTRTLQLTKIN